MRLSHKLSRVAVTLNWRTTRRAINFTITLDTRRVPSIQYPRYTTRFRGGTMGPRIFYRVEDEDSRARYIKRQGIIAEDRDTSVDFRKKGDALLDQIAQHLDWSNRHPTPFISTYCDEWVAWREAERRVTAGKSGVKIYKIDTGARKERTEYRNIRLLAESLDYYIPFDAWNNSKHEYVFLYRIPDSVVVGWEDLSMSTIS